MIPYGVEKKVVTLPTRGEILLGVVNDPICADGSNHVHIPGTAYAGHIRAERLGDLHGERTHASRCTIDEDHLPRPNPSLVAKTLQSRESRNRCKLVALEIKADSQVTTGELIGIRAFRDALKGKASLVRGVVLHSGKSRPLDAVDIALPWGWMVPEPR
jgi:hypothetical protein